MNPADHIRMPRFHFLSLRLWFGRLNFKHVDDTLFSERYGFRPSIVIGKLRITWVRYRKLPK